MWVCVEDQRFKELAHMIVGTGRSKIAGQESGLETQGSGNVAF